MDNLWAPWPLRYILGEREPGCFRCRKPQENNDTKNHLLIRDRTCFALLNAYPYNPGHLLIAPYQHTDKLDELAESELADLMLLTRRCQQILTRAMNPQGF